MTDNSAAITAPQAAAAGGEADAEEVPLVAGLGVVAGCYDLVLCDIWGVLHDGLVAFPAASDALLRYRGAGGSVVLVSNAPRPNSVVAAQLDRLGVPRAAFDAIVTSGDLSRAAVIERPGETVHHVGPARDVGLFKGLEVTFGDIESADYVVCTGLVDDERETAQDYRAALERMRARSLWMICANPDIVVQRGDRLIPCAGALALAYEEIGGAVFYAGKPHAPVYEAALALAAARRGTAVPRHRVLAIGDAIRTDVAGAANFGIDVWFIAHGIHAGELGLGDGALEIGRLRTWLAGQAVRPQAVAHGLAWE